MNELLFADAATGGRVDADIVDACRKVFSGLPALTHADLIATINRIREELAKHSPFRGQPVDCVRWVPASQVSANDYNPNSVAPPEMELLRLSIENDGYTMPIVAWEVDGGYEVVDGFHRSRVGKEYQSVSDMIHGHLPLSVIKNDRTAKGDRMASTVRHNRARGKHRVEGMSDIVLELKRRNWSDKKIGKELGMDPDEVLRLAQITGLAEMFADREFSKAWVADDWDDEAEGVEIDG